MDNLAKLQEALTEAEARLAEAIAKADKAQGEDLERLAVDVSTAETLVRLLRRQVDQAQAELRANERAHQEKDAKRQHSKAVADLQAQHGVLVEGWAAWSKDILTIAQLVPALWRELGRLRRETDAMQATANQLEISVSLPETSPEAADIVRRITRGWVPGLVLPPREARQ